MHCCCSRPWRQDRYHCCCRGDGNASRLVCLVRSSSGALAAARGQQLLRGDAGRLALQRMLLSVGSGLSARPCATGSCGPPGVGLSVQAASPRRARSSGTRPAARARSAAAGPPASAGPSSSSEPHGLPPVSWRVELPCMSWPCVPEATVQDERLHAAGAASSQRWRKRKIRSCGAGARNTTCRTPYSSRASSSLNSKWPSSSWNWNFLVHFSRRASSDSLRSTVTTAPLKMSMISTSS
mmetsp:Transcript_79943/g.252713  ORF Transcript_79943/g.252713 Transcript_79943/m.252713 type:complete len:239 (+) Transcript_79943:54-770(+)